MQRTGDGILPSPTTAGKGFSTVASLCAQEKKRQAVRQMGISVFCQYLQAEGKKKAAVMTTDESMDSVQSSRIAQSHFQSLLLNDGSLLLSLYRFSSRKKKPLIGLLLLLSFSPHRQ